MTPDYFDNPDFQRASLHEITGNFSESGLRQRLLIEIQQTEWDEETAMRVLAALDLATDAHAGEMRGDHPYSTHFLRVAVRLMSSEHIGVPDADMVVAALLHDTVENHVTHYDPSRAASTPAESREIAFEAVEARFGVRSARLVSALTNPEWPAGVTREAKNELYQEHVRELLHTDEEAAIVKLSDFIDNCSGLAYNEDPDFARHLASKYLPLIPDFRMFVIVTDLLSEDRKHYLREQLDRTEDRCLDVMYRE